METRERLPDGPKTGNASAGLESWLKNAYEKGMVSKETAEDLLTRYRAERKGVKEGTKRELAELRSAAPARPRKKVGTAEDGDLRKIPAPHAPETAEKPRKSGIENFSKDELWALAKHWNDTAEHLVGVYDRNSEGLGMQFVKATDVAAIGFIESLFDAKARNPTGGSGAMQITKYPVLEIASNPAYRSTVEGILRAEGAKHIGAYRNPKELYDPKANAVIGISYARRLEETPPLPAKLFSKMERMGDHFSKAVGRMLAGKNVPVNREEMGRLLEKLRNDRGYQERFKVFTRYNGVASAFPKYGETMPHKYYYAVACLYASEHSFGKLGKPGDRA